MKKILTVFAFISLMVCPVLKAENKIIIDKPNYNLIVVNEENDTIFQAPVCLGKNLGQKTKRGDLKTPEGSFSIKSIENSSGWGHSKSIYGGGYGPYFMRLKVPGNNSIGIHGTNKPETIGRRMSEGCIRLHNEDLVELINFVGLGTEVVVLPDVVVVEETVEDTPEQNP